MTDIFSREFRSEIMRKVKSKRNKSTELLLIDFFKQNNITGWRRNYNIIGNPDFVFCKYRIIIFTDGCFWHGHICRNLTPKNNQEYWNRKINNNIQRDKKYNRILKSKNWKVIRLWECQMKDKDLKKKLRPLMA